LRSAAVAGLVAAALVVSLVEGVPPRLPGVALGTGVLLHAERTLAALAVVVATLTILVRAAEGRLPVEVSTTGLRYDAAATESAAVHIAALQREVASIGEEVSTLGRALDAAEGAA
jgi:hypothetical protein